MNEEKQKPRKNRKYSESFGYAFEGFKTVLKEERNMKTHSIIGILAILFSFYLPLSLNEQLWIILVVFMVIGIEIINTVIENLVDLVTKEYHPIAKKVKDMAAAAVLLTSIFSVIVGLIIFLPKIFELFF